MNHCKTYLLLCLLLLPCWCRAGLLSDSASIALLTCAPGEALYERYGHTALWVHDPETGMDEIYNYGIFDFYADHFFWRFIKGETFYRLGRETLCRFMQQYTYYGREVNIQVLRLTPQQRDDLYRALLTNYQPENRTYLYNFVFDNCATRPYRLLANVLVEDTTLADDRVPAIRSTYTGAEGMTFRRFISRYTPRGSWGDLGINLLFGPAADRPMTGEERLFLPEELMWYIHEAYLGNGTPLVTDEQVTPFTVEHTPWYRTWYFGMLLLFMLLTGLSVYDRRRGKRSRWADYILYSVYAMLLIIVTFLTFFSIHPLVGFGPYLPLIPSLHLCARIVYLWR